MGVHAVASIINKLGGSFFPYPSAWPVWAFLWPVIGGDTFSPPAPILGPVKTNGHANNCSSGRIWYKMCNIRIDGASGICVGANFRRLVSTKDWNTSNRTDLPLRPEATKLEIRLRTLEKRQELYRPPLVPLPFPLLILCLNVVPLRLPTGRSARKAPTLRHVCDEVDEKTETKMELKFNDESYSPAKFHAVYYARVWKEANAVYDPLRRPDLAFLFVFFARLFVSYGIIWETLTSLNHIYWADIRKENNTEVRYRDGHAEHLCMCAKFHGLSLKNIVGI